MLMTLQLPHAHTEAVDAPYGGAVEGHQQSLVDVGLPQDPQKEEPLLCLVSQHCGQVLLGVDFHQTEVCDPFSTVTTNDYGSCLSCFS